MRKKHGMARAIKTILRGAIGSPLTRLTRGLLDERELHYVWKKLDSVAAVNKGTQILLSLKYQELARSGHLPDWHDVEFRCFSQNGEDGLLLYVFALIGTTSRRCVEMCAGDGIECNTANLLVNHRWVGLLIDGDGDNVARGQAFYHACRDTFSFPPKFRQAWISAENVNTLLRDNGFGGDLDLLSIDLDGMDYWVWKALDCTAPRVVIVEYESGWGPTEALTRPYQANFQADFLPSAGASLAALAKLGAEKGYRLVGCNSSGVNAVFVRQGIADDLLPAVDPRDCFRHPMSQYRRDCGRPTPREGEWIHV
jgi:hypothetical protein